MRQRLRSPTYIALIAVALIGVSVPIVTAGGAVGEPEEVPQGVLELSLGNDDLFTWSEYDDDGVQTVLAQEGIRTRRNDCTAITYEEDPARGYTDLVELDAIGGVPGFQKDGFGVLAANEGSGEPCGRADSPDEGISVKLSGDLDGLLMKSVDLDVEYKFGGVLVIEAWRDGMLVATSPEFDASVLNDDGPDSADGDNHRTEFAPSDEDGPIHFDKIVLRPTLGSISLEGGADGTRDGTLAPSGSSQFELVRVYDGTLTCGDSVSDSDGDISGTFTVVSTINGNTTSCGEKVYDIGADGVARTFLFLPYDINTMGQFIYRGMLTAENEPLSIVELNGGIGGLQRILLEYDPEGGDEFRPLQMCKAQPNGDFSYTNLTENVLPPNQDPDPEPQDPPYEPWCFYEVNVTPTGQDGDGNQLGTEVWYLVGIDDPNWSFK